MLIAAYAFFYNLKNVWVFSLIGVATAIAVGIRFFPTNIRADPDRDVEIGCTV
jgi:hypothetical protein